MIIDKEILKGHIESVILSLLCKESMYGYQLAKETREISEGDFELKEGTMYPALKRMETGGLIESYWGSDDSGGGRRKYYRILPLGKERFLEKKQEWQFVQVLLSKFFGGENHEND